MAQAHAASPDSYCEDQLEVAEYVGRRLALRAHFEPVWATLSRMSPSTMTT